MCFLVAWVSERYVFDGLVCDYCGFLFVASLEHRDIQISTMRLDLLDSPSSKIITSCQHY